MLDCIIIGLVFRFKACYSRLNHLGSESMVQDASCYVQFEYSKYT
jgi:hypothetical protein